MVTGDKTVMDIIIYTVLTAFVIALAAGYAGVPLKRFQTRAAGS